MGRQTKKGQASAATAQANATEKIGDMTAAIPTIARALAEDTDFCCRVLKCAMQIPEVKAALFEIVSLEQRQHEVNSRKLIHTTMRATQNFFQSIRMK